LSQEYSDSGNSNILVIDTSVLLCTDHQLLKYDPIPILLGSNESVAEEEEPEFVMIDAQAVTNLENAEYDNTNHQ